MVRVPGETKLDRCAGSRGQDREILRALKRGLCSARLTWPGDLLSGVPYLHPYIDGIGSSTLPMTLKGIN